MLHTALCAESGLVILWGRETIDANQIVYFPWLASSRTTILLRSEKVDIITRPFRYPPPPPDCLALSVGVGLASISASAYVCAARICRGSTVGWLCTSHGRIKAKSLLSGSKHHSALSNPIRNQQGILRPEVRRDRNGVTCIEVHDTIIA